MHSAWLAGTGCAMLLSAASATSSVCVSLSWSWLSASLFTCAASASLIYYHNMASLMLQQLSVSKSTIMPTSCGLLWMLMPRQHGTPTPLRPLPSSHPALQPESFHMYVAYFSVILHVTCNVYAQTDCMKCILPKTLASQTLASQMFPLMQHA